MQMYLYLKNPNLIQLHMTFLRSASTTKISCTIWMVKSWRILRNLGGAMCNLSLLTCTLILDDLWNNFHSKRHFSNIAPVSTALPSLLGQLKGLANQQNSTRFSPSYIFSGDVTHKPAVCCFGRTKRYKSCNTNSPRMTHLSSRLGGLFAAMCTFCLVMDLFGSMENVEIKFNKRWLIWCPSNKTWSNM